MKLPGKGKGRGGNGGQILQWKAHINISNGTFLLILLLPTADTHAYSLLHISPIVHDLSLIESHTNLTYFACFLDRASFMVTPSVCQTH